MSDLSVAFAIGWACMNFTSFATAYDPDDRPYRLAVLVGGRMMGLVLSRR